MGTLDTTAEALPIRQFTDTIVETVRQNSVTVIIAETGSGKTTQIPQMLEDAGVAGTGMVGVTQPRRVVSCMFKHCCDGQFGTKFELYNVSA